MNDKIYELDKSDSQILEKTPMILLGLSIEAISSSHDSSSIALATCLDSLRCLLIPDVIQHQMFNKVCTL